MTWTPPASDPEPPERTGPGGLGYAVLTGVVMLTLFVARCGEKIVMGTRAMGVQPGTVPVDPNAGKRVAKEVEPLPRPTM